MMAAVMSPAGLFIFEDQMLHATVIRSITEGGFPSYGLSGEGGGCCLISCPLGLKARTIISNRDFDPRESRNTEIFKSRGDIP